jgi:hypothetical protein
MMMNSPNAWPTHWSPKAPTLPGPILAPLKWPTRIEDDVHRRIFREISISHDVRLGEIEDFVIEDSDWSSSRCVSTEGRWLDGWGAEPVQLEQVAT